MGLFDWLYVEDSKLKVPNTSAPDCPPPKIVKVHGYSVAIPHEKKYATYKGIPQLDHLERQLAVRGLKDPWIRNMIYHYDRPWAFRTLVQRITFVAGRQFRLAFVLVAGIIVMEKLGAKLYSNYTGKGDDEHHGHH